MKNFLRVFGKLPMGGQLIDLCFCDADIDGDRQNGGVSGKANKVHSPQAQREIKATNDSNGTSVSIELKTTELLDPDGVPWSQSSYGGGKNG